jgi:hypothetical protein
MYDDAYPTCRRTYVTLRIYHDAIDPAFVSEQLGLDPSETIRKGDRRPSGFVIPRHGWFLSSRDRVSSKDCRRHLDWLVERISPAADTLRQLANDGFQIDISCFWDSESGHGGPTLSPDQMKRLAGLDLELWFDVYILGDMTKDRGSRSKTAQPSSWAGCLTCAWT